MKNIWYYLTYPIRLLLKDTIEDYKIRLLKIKERQVYSNIKLRRKGMIRKTSFLTYTDVISSIKYKNFIKNWSLRINQNEKNNGII